MKIGFAQINPTVGDLRGNFEKIVAAYDRLARAGAELSSRPELAITGYPPQDLVFKSRFVPQNLEVLEKLQARAGRRGACSSVSSIATKAAANRFIMPPPCFNAAQPIAKTHKSLLPTYDVFDEDRYFEPAREVAPLSFRGQKDRRDHLRRHLDGALSAAAALRRRAGARAGRARRRDDSSI